MTGLTVVVGVGLLAGLLVSSLVFVIGGILKNQRLLLIANMAIIAITSVGLVTVSLIVRSQLEGPVRNPMGIFMLVMSPISAVISLLASWRLFRSGTPGSRSGSKWVLAISLAAAVIFAVVAYWTLQPA